MAPETGARRLDSHHHLWTLQRVERGDYHWMPEEVLLRNDHLPEHLVPGEAEAFQCISAERFYGVRIADGGAF